MPLIDNVEWKKYLQVCKEQKAKPSLEGFIKYKVFTQSNAEKWERLKQQNATIMVLER